MHGSTRDPWPHRLRGVFWQSSRWLIPGLGVKRWLGMVLLGTTLTGVGLAFLVLDVYRTAPETWWLPVLSTASLRFLPRLLRRVVFGGIGVGLIAGGIWGLNRVLMAPFMRPGRRVVDALTSHLRRAAAPRLFV